MNLIIVDLKNELHGGNYSLISNRLLKSINVALQTGSKIVLFHNRTGYARRIICEDCRQIIQCAKCELPQVGILGTENETEKAQLLRLRCPYCQSERALGICPKCNGVKWKFLSFGLERVKTDLEKQTGARVKLVSSLESKLSVYQSLLVDFDVLLATREPLIDVLLEGKSQLSLSAILNLDTSFYLPDFNANLNAFNRLLQFRKFCRQQGTQNAIIQTYAPEHPTVIYGASGDEVNFKKFELAIRHDLNYPPGNNLIKLICQNQSEKIARQTASLFATELKNLSKDYQISPSYPSWPPQVRGQFRYQVLIKIPNQNVEPDLRPLSARSENLQLLGQKLGALTPSWIIDVDPISSL
ncbi:MAG: hypothetical protein A2445_02070 [Candidatus Jacksonbacteria bacterium RIFOXYC2_FULL_44_29]|nr:MAG: Primosomal protein N' [Parcubacteria group bacterium GW2011_GWC2_44_22]OGY76426.1 MAG: hypothetical protein A2240_05370 [Candidatus Jacksonbacteria bacterium RIFOXYA2_FULL_43_12]OGY78405.1 MAG: hypothetical protein A2445_02070 [Candidatus Jacksonbacteria bacterium RIFOXYC2_FULL_44_29]OGY78561.1 MAG: hypothetical protein A2550_03825 [Candidatus Jacksonbacteria bacterium RIFOXYD2_FULL_43_21]HBH45999.1 hypothetical protein [Candidatus Jacksonbacteria bacterium]